MKTKTLLEFIIPKKYISLEDKESKGSRSLVDNGVNIGVEIELENLYEMLDENTNHPVEEYEDFLNSIGWSIDKDGSLRGGGVEFTFRMPEKGSKVVLNVKKLHGFLTKFNPVASPRCSVHVHLDASGLTPQQIMNWICLYGIYEDLLFEVYAPSRKTSHYCVPLLDSASVLTGFRRFMSNPESIAGSLHEEAIGRYCAVNIASLTRFGSLEFRHHPGTWDYKKILEWVNVLLSIRKYAIQPELTPFKLFEFVESLGFEQFTDKVFVKRLCKKLKTLNLKDKFYTGYRKAQTLPYIEPRINTPKELIEKFKIPEPVKTPYLGFPEFNMELPWRYDPKDHKTIWICEKFYDKETRYPKEAYTLSAAAFTKSYQHYVKNKSFPKDWNFQTGEKTSTWEESITKVTQTYYWKG